MHLHEKYRQNKKFSGLVKMFIMILVMINIFIFVGGKSNAATYPVEGTTGICDISSPNNEKYHFVYFGDTNGRSRYDIKGPIRYRVLYTKTNSGTRKGLVPDKGRDALFMLSEYGLTPTKWDIEYGQDYASSYIKKWLNGDVLDDCFSDKEKEAIIKTGTLYDTDTGTPLECVCENKSDIIYYATKFGTEKKTNRLSGDRLFLLSAEEIVTKEYGFTTEEQMDFGKNQNYKWHLTKKDSCYIGNENGMKYDWWLRSAYTSAEDMVTVVNDKDILTAKPSDTFTCAVRFALNVDAKYIMYASYDGDDGKSTCEFRNIDSIQQVEANPASNPADNSAYKLTIVEGDPKIWGSNFDILVSDSKVEGAPGETLKLNYSGCQIGDDQNICAIIKSDNSSYFARLVVGVQEDRGTITMTIPSDVDIGECELIVYNETNNGPKKTNTARYDKLKLITEKKEIITISTQFGISKDGPWRSTGNEVLENDLYQTEKLETLYMKVTATSNSGVTPVITISNDNNNISSLVEGTTNIFKITDNTGDITPIIAQAAGKTETGADAVFISEIIGKRGKKNPITITLQYGLSNNKDGTWYDSEEALKASSEYKNATKILKVYVKATATSAKGELDKNIDWLDSNNNSI